MTEPRDHPGRVWSNLTRQQKYVVMELYGTSKLRVPRQTVESLVRKGLITYGAELAFPLTPLGLAVAEYRLARGTDDGLHHRDCDRVRDSEAMCHPDCPVFHYLREQETHA